MSAPPIPKDRESMRRLLRRVNKELNQIKEDGGMINNRRVDEMLQFWQTHRPQMTQRLQGLHQGRAPRMLAEYLEHKAGEAEGANLRAGMYVTEAREQADRDWLLMDEESQEDDETTPLPLDALTM